MSVSSVFSYFQSFVPGLRLVDGGELKQLANYLFSSASGIVAKAGGGQALATPINASYNQVDTCVTNSDSVMLPPALPGLEVFINNNTGQTLAVFGVPVNAGNGGVGDTIAATGSTVQQPTATGVTQVTAKIAVYACFKAGQWKQGLSA